MTPWLSQGIYSVASDWTVLERNARFLLNWYQCVLGELWTLMHRASLNQMTTSPAGRKTHITLPQPVLILCFFFFSFLLIKDSLPDSPRYFFVSKIPIEWDIWEFKNQQWLTISSSLWSRTERFKWGSLHMMRVTCFQCRQMVSWSRPDVLSRWSQSSYEPEPSENEGENGCNLKKSLAEYTVTLWFKRRHDVISWSALSKWNQLNDTTSQTLLLRWWQFSLYSTFY